MVTGDKDGTIREAVGIFFEAGNLKEAVEELHASGFGDAELGLLAGDATVKQKLGKLYTDLNRSSDDAKAPDTGFVDEKSTKDTVHALFGGALGLTTVVAGSAIVATAGVLGGAFAAGAAGAAAVGGFGAVASAIIGKSDADKLQEQIDSGHLLLFVRTPDTAAEKKAVDIIENHSGFDVRVYSVPATGLAA